MNQRTLKKFLSLPANTYETWQGGIVTIGDVFDAAPVDDAGEMALVIWRSASTELVHAKPTLVAGPGRLDGFVDVMLELCTDHDFPFRPARIECNDRELADGLSDLLRDSGTSASFVAEMPEWNALLQDLRKHFRSAELPLPSLKDAGCSERQIREFANAAAAFYRAGLWDYLDDVDLIKIESPRPPRYLKNAVVLGSASKTYGLGFFEDAQDHYDMMAHQGDLDEVTLFSLTFDTPDEVPSADIQVWRELDLPLETGEAFPSMNFFSKEKSRRPTARELNFATVLLKALAVTTEEDIDSGRWTKSVELLGESKECVLSIPNLIDPPDRAEWMRRGLMPEQRGNERVFKLVQQFIEEHGSEMSLDELNAAMTAKFTGPIDDFDYPMDTPADRAEALCHKAIDTFGRRRIQLAKQALDEDPTHVEANVLLAESTRSSQRRLDLFRRAVEMGRTQLGPTTEEGAGRFWGHPDTRPFMRACHGLAATLREAGQPNEAIAQYQEMLRLNPEDNQSVRYEIIPLLLMHDREAEAVKLLERYCEETAFWHYMKSLIEFRFTGRSPKSKKALRSAFQANKHVVPLMQSDDPPLLPDSYALGSPEEAAICVRGMVEVWSETEGYVEWMLQQYSIWEKEKKRRARDRKRKARKKAASQKRRRR